MATQKLPEIYFDTRAGAYWLRIAPARFLLLEKRDITDHFAFAGMDVDGACGPLTNIKKALLVARLERWVDYAGPLAGHPCGLLVTSDGGRALVTSEARVIAPGAGPFPFIERFLEELFGDYDHQVTAVCNWLKAARESLLAHDFRPGQMLVLAGPSNCGKSLFQAFLTEFLGGRMAKPYRYMTGESNFNSDLAAAEHWAIEDEHGSTDIRTRRKFGTSLKEATVNRDLSVHAKGRQAVTLPTFRRLSLSVNDEAENLMILPPMDPSIVDKVMLLRCSKANVGGDRLRTWARITKELPAFVRYLNRSRINPDLECSRFGVRAYHNPQLVEQLQEISPEERLLNLVDEVIFGSKGRKDDEWQGSADELEKRLRGSEFAFAVDKLLGFHNACGTYLRRLAGHYPDRITSTKLTGKHRGRVVWRITR